MSSGVFIFFNCVVVKSSTVFSFKCSYQENVSFLTKKKHILVILKNWTKGCSTLTKRVIAVSGYGTFHFSHFHENPLT